MATTKKNSPLIKLGFFLVVAFFLFSAPVLGVSVKLVSNTPYCFDCQTIYEVCNDGDPVQDFNINYYGAPGAKTFTAEVQTAAFQKQTITEKAPIYQDKIVTKEALNNVSGKLESIETTTKEIIGYENVQKEIEVQQPLTKAALGDNLAALAPGKCARISVSGTLKPDQALDNVLNINGKEYTAWAWWNSSFIYAYNVTMTETAGIDRTAANPAGSEPLSINISDINCTYATKEDARFVDNSGQEIPSFVTSDKLLKLSLNVTASFDGIIGRIYCGAPVEARDYPGGLVMYDLKGNLTQNNGFNISIPINATSFAFHNGTITAGSSAGGITWDNPQWATQGYFNGFLTPFQSNSPIYPKGNCHILENSSVYTLIRCDSNSLTYAEFWASQKMVHIWYDYQSGTSAMCFMTNLNNGGTGQKHIIYSNGSLTYMDAIGAPVSVTLNMPIFSVYKAGDVQGLFAFAKNQSISGARYISMYARTNSEDPVGSFGSTSFTCDTPSWDSRNWTKQAQYWQGYASIDTDQMSEIYLARTNPVSVSIGDLEIGCVSNWTCSDYAACNESNISACIGVEDLNECGGEYEGELSIFDESCQFDYPPYWVQYPPNISINSSVQYQIQLNASDINGNIDMWAINESTGTFLSQTGLLTLNYTPSETGLWNILVSVYDTGFNFVDGYFWVNVTCYADYYCSDFAACGEDNISVCLNVSDINQCGFEFEGNLTDYDIPCTPTEIVPSLFDLKNGSLNAIAVFLGLIILWLGSGFLALYSGGLFEFRLLFFFIGIFLGIDAWSIHWAFGTMFFLISVLSWFIEKIEA